MQPYNINRLIEKNELMRVVMFLAYPEEEGADLGPEPSFSGGYGGGGMGIGICFDAKTRQKIEEEWKKSGIVPVKANIAPSLAKKK